MKILTSGDSVILSKVAYHEECRVIEFLNAFGNADHLISNGTILINFPPYSDAVDQLIDMLVEQFHVKDHNIIEA